MESPGNTTHRTALLRRPQVETITGLSRSSIYALMAAGKFPKNVAVSSKAVRWLEAEVMTWVETKVAQRDAKGSRTKLRTINSPDAIIREPL